jgi:TolA-binding protein
MMRRLIGITVLALMIVSCQSEEKKQVEEAIKSNTEEHKEMLAYIDSLEDVVYVDTMTVEGPATAELLKAYLKFSRKFVGDKEKTPEYMYKAAALSRANKLSVKAIKLYEQILTDYPDYKRNPEIAFLIAFTYDDEIKQKEEAKEAYQKVIDDYPGDKWAEQAAERLKTIDMTDEELIDYFMKKNQSGGADS